MLMVPQPPIDRGQPTEPKPLSLGDAGARPFRLANLREPRFRSTCTRAFAFSIALVPIILLVTARRLEPNSKGLGTHQQLGLPPCSMRVMFGIRCPGCGMTTSWAHFTRGQMASSFRVNAGGFLLACFSMLLAFLAMRTGFSGQMPSLRTQQTTTFAAVGIAAVTLLDWIMRLAN
jgi:hypothetical protein